MQFVNVQAATPGADVLDSTYRSFNTVDDVSIHPAAAYKMDPEASGVFEVTGQSPLADSTTDTLNYQIDNDHMISKRATK